jgi:hypothetical protein
LILREKEVELEAVGGELSMGNSLSRISHRLSAVVRGKAEKTGQEACPTGLPACAL